MTPEQRLAARARHKRFHGNNPEVYSVGWMNAGGPNECKHGYAAGVPCVKCDSAGVAADLPAALDALDNADTQIAALQAELRVINLRAQSAEKIMAAGAKLLGALDQRYRWRPIAEIHEDYGPVVLMDIHDPGSLQIGSNLETDFNESDWTHFSQIALLSHEEAERLASEVPA